MFSGGGGIICNTSINNSPHWHFRPWDSNPSPTYLKGAGCGLRCQLSKEQFIIGMMNGIEPLSSGPSMDRRLANWDRHHPPLSGHTPTGQVSKNTTKVTNFLLLRTPWPLKKKPFCPLQLWSTLFTWVTLLYGPASYEVHSFSPKHFLDSVILSKESNLSYRYFSGN